MKNLTLKLLDKEYSIYRLSSQEDIPIDIFSRGFSSVTKTSEETSIVCESSIVIKDSVVSKNWTCLKFVGPLSLNQTGILAGISNILAKEKISIFVVSTYDTDYIFIKTQNIKKSLNILQYEGYSIELNNNIEY
jgi:hypothetical protein